MLGLLPFTREGRRRAAARWLARLHGPGAEAHQARFERWIAGRKNAAAFERVAKSYDVAALLRLSAGPTERRPGRASPGPRQAMAAALLIAAAAPIAFIVSRPFLAGDHASRLMIATSVGEIRAVRLADGSQVVLDTDTLIEVPSRPASPEVRLKRGRARFSPAHSLIVRAPTATIEGRGGAFDVGVSDGGVAVASYGGEVRVTGRGDAPVDDALVRPGEQLRLAVGAAKTSRITDRRWTDGLLEFDGEPLGAALEQANRYSTQKVMLGDRRLEDLRLTGVFKAGNAERLARALALTFDLRLERLDGGDLLLRPR